MLEGAFHGSQKFLQGDGFFQEIQRADFGGFHGGVDAGVAAHHHHGHVELAGFGPLFEQGNAVAIRHPNVQQHHGGAGLVSKLAGFFGIFGQGNRIAFVLQDFRQQIADAHFIIYNQNITAAHRFPSVGVK